MVEETAHVDKRRHVTGIVRVNKRITQEEQEIDEPQSVEKVEVERVPVDRWVDAPEPVRQEGDTTIIPLHEEVAVVVKRLKVVEEVRMTRHRSTHHRRSCITLRRAEADIERLPPPDTEDRN
ncbi:MAG TPA: YsnF/AvaK domain-containing protein [Azospirillaceae bacterium]|nr:YsnF/AvaK domain-containing protein [Azospirillaceae bacterium]